MRTTVVALVSAGTLFLGGYFTNAPSRSQHKVWYEYSSDVFWRELNFVHGVSCFL